MNVSQKLVIIFFPSCYGMKYQKIDQVVTIDYSKDKFNQTCFYNYRNKKTKSRVTQSIEDLASITLIMLTGIA